MKGLAAWAVTHADHVLQARYSSQYRRYSVTSESHESQTRIMCKEGRSIIIMLSINAARPKHVVVLVLRICALSYSDCEGNFMLAVGDASAFCLSFKTQ